MLKFAVDYNVSNKCGLKCAGEYKMRHLKR